MMFKAFPVLMLGGALVLAGCAGKRDVLPPAATQPAPPPPAPIDQAQTVPPPADVGSRALPGSQAALVEAAGSDTIHFAFDRYDIDDEARSILTRQARWLQDNGNVNAMIEGHTDERGTREYNLALGERRANAAKNFLVAQGVATGRLTTVSYGKERPAAEGSNEAAWAQNRRAVTVVVAR